MKLKQIKLLSNQDAQTCLFLSSKIGEGENFKESLDLFFDAYSTILNPFNVSLFFKKDEHHVTLNPPFIHNYGLAYIYTNHTYYPPQVYFIENFLKLEQPNHVFAKGDKSYYLSEIGEEGILVIQSQKTNFGFDSINGLNSVMNLLSKCLVNTLKLEKLHSYSTSKHNTQSPYPTLRFDKEANILFLNHSAKKIKTHFEDLKWVYADMFKECLSAYQTKEYEQIILDTPYSITIKPIPDQNVVYVYAIDISTRKNIENKLKEEKEKAEKSAQQKMEFLSTMSHEIRTPMNSIIGSINLLIDTQLNPYQSKKLEMMRFAADNLLRLINEILDFNKLEANKVSLEKIRFSVADTMEHLFMMYAQQAEDKNIGYELKTTSLPVNFVMGDPTRLSQVLLNLISNAIKFTEEGAVSFDVDCTYQNDKSIVYQFIVKDSGIGISQNRIDSIFEAFTQADTSTTRKFGGTGLGLNITKKIVDLLEGQLTLESSEGQGSTFKVSLPFTIAENQEEEKKKDNFQIVEGNLKGKKVLLVDDNEFNILIASEFLNRWEAEYITAKNGEDAILKLHDEEQTIDIILMDLQMPVMNGYEATKIIREKRDDYYQNLPIVALSADVASENISEIESKGFNGFASKPFDPETLLTKLITLIEKKTY
ncbi:ATP-binding protein [Flammeovirga aprica]|uniref:histidine kinase n=1 Tax=Flammeovirga aprica JL-4 TaxID=694437 RepID=A0A7X9P0W1_9BACT|nr:ATP-binding protein [Flammeovirga aprica]NME67463.1 response regulator [Flammeovirga aprica JL-4]